MLTRVLKFTGEAFSPSGNVSVVAIFNGVEVHNGPIPTTPLEPPTSHGGQLLDLWQTEIDASVTGNIPLSIQVTGGTLYFGALFGNSPYNPPNEFDDVSPIDPASDGKNNVLIDGVAPPPRIPAPGEEGPWQYPIPSGSTFTCSMTVDPPINA